MDDAIQLQFDTANVDWGELGRLFAAAGLNREQHKLRRAFLNSTVVCFAKDGARLVGAARALSDGEYHAAVYSVAVHPDYQRCGIGTRMMRGLLARLPVWRVLLVADGDARRFYARLGFEPYEDIMARIDPARLHETRREAPD
jgi:ribosomal protein S18 acetylase RimI-like enzyme